MNKFEEPEEEKFVEKTRAEIAEEELKKMELNKLVEEADEEVKTQSGDYKAAYDQYLQQQEGDVDNFKVAEPTPGKKPEPAPENPEAPKTPDPVKKEVPSNPEKAPTPVAPEPTPEKKPEVKAEAPKTSDPVKNSEKPAEAPKNSEPDKPATSEKSKAEKIPEKLTDEQYEAIKRAKKDLDAVKNYKKKHTGLLQRLGLRRSEDAEVDRDLKERQKAYDEVILKIMKENGMMEGAVESAFAERCTKEFLAQEREKIELQREKIEPEKKALFDKVKKVFGNKYVQLIVGTAILGVAIAAPPVGFLTSLGFSSGIVPASFGPAAKALWAGLGGIGVGAGLINLRNALKKDNINTINASDLRGGGRRSRNSGDLDDL